ncbi:MAG TPA: phosphoglycerate mutase family protein [Blastocatellia bacterium]|nr:phosphoglycerate mutase family protein [Blastocatellia bacterium]
MPTIWLIRHGESESNAGVATADPETINLTHRGMAQSKRIATAFNQAPALIVTSSFIRTKQPAAATLEQFPRVPCEEWAVQEVTYLSLPREKALTYHIP